VVQLLEASAVEDCDVGIGTFIMASKGGGLQILESTLAAHSSRISGCRSTEWEAGGLNADSNAVVTFLNSKLNGCYARTLCGGVYIKGASLTMVNSTVQHCLAESAAGLRLFQSHVVIEFSVFEECHAAFRPGWDSTGGAVDSSGVNTCIFRNAIIRNCSSAGFGTLCLLCLRSFNLLLLIAWVHPCSQAVQ
jgi:hypothetical protein